MSGVFLSIAQAHWERYPLMEPQDFCKLAYQSEFGPAHMIQSPDRVLLGLMEERKASGTEPKAPEPIGNGLCRFPITQALSTLWELPLLGRMFTRTMALTEGTAEGLAAKLDQLAALPVPGMGEYLERYRREGCPSLHHSGTFRNAYDPHYRVIRQDYACYMPTLASLEKVVRERARRERPALIAIDGRCGSGKSGFAAVMDVLVCSSDVVHMDDFYLPWAKRGPDWQDVPAGNMDLERFRREVLTLAGKGEPGLYRPYDCPNDRLLAPVELWEPLRIVEGTYSQHPSLADR